MKNLLRLLAVALAAGVMLATPGHAAEKNLTASPFRSIRAIRP
jgi:hypothetical protein